MNLSNPTARKIVAVVDHLDNFVIDDLLMKGANVGGAFDRTCREDRKLFVRSFDRGSKKKRKEKKKTVISQQQDRCIPKLFVYGVAEEFMSQLTPIFESLRQKEDLPCSYPLHMHAPSYHWVNKKKRKKTLSTLLISAVDGVM